MMSDQIIDEFRIMKPSDGSIEWIAMILLISFRNSEI